jgi:plasmid stability protein
MKKRNTHHKSIQLKLESIGVSVGVKIIVSNLSEEASFLVERDLIAFYGRENLVNLTDGGEGISNPSVETRKKLAKATLGNKNMLGKNHSKETKAKISAAKMGHSVSMETRAKLSAHFSGRERRPMSAETKTKISVAQKAKRSKSVLTK